MISAKTITILVSGSLLLHGIAHAIALGALLLQGILGSSTNKISVRSWLLPSMTTKVAARVTAPFWIVSTIGFLAAAGSFWGVVLRFDQWSPLAIAGAVASILGVAFISGTWPGSPNPRRSLLNTVIALIMDVMILVTRLWLHWPSPIQIGS